MSRGEKAIALIAVSFIIVVGSFINYMLIHVDDIRDEQKYRTMTFLNVRE